MSWLRDIDMWFIDSVLPHRATYYAAARRMSTGQAEAEDLVQEAYARVIAHPDWRGIGAPRAFVLKVIHNLGVERMRRSRVVPIGGAGELDRLGLADQAPDVEQRLAHEGDLFRLRTALEALPPQCRRVVQLRKLDNLPPRQIADAMGISLSTVEKHLAHGVRLLTEKLARTEPETRRSWTRHSKIGQR